MYIGHPTYGISSSYQNGVLLYQKHIYWNGTWPGNRSGRRRLILSSNPASRTQSFPNLLSRECPNGSAAPAPSIAPFPVSFRPAVPQQRQPAFLSHFPDPPSAKKRDHSAIPKRLPEYLGLTWQRGTIAWSGGRWDPIDGQSARCHCAERGLETTSALSLRWC